MEHDFWENAWQNDRTGWRQSQPGALLVSQWPTLALPATSTVLVTLCGDTPDMRWLMDQGYHVVGCDLSELALQRFLQANDLQAEREEQDELVLFHAPGLQLIAGDFMSLTPETVGPIHAFFDRAATIALPPAMRRSYARQMATLMQPATTGLLIGIEYNQQEMKGPPFSVPSQSVQDLYANDFSIEILHSHAGGELLGKLKERGVTHLTETAYQLTRRV